MASSAPAGLELLSRPGCHLCEALWPAVVAAARAAGLPAVRVDIDQDRDLRRAFTLRIPVVRLDGRVVAEGRVDPLDVAGAVARATAARGPQAPATGQSPMAHARVTEPPAPAAGRRIEPR